MTIDVKPGKYVVAVSGGVDSMVLLDLLSKKKSCVLIVAHFDHGIRPDSKIDRALVQSIATKLGLPFVYNEGNLGPDTNEADARKARYDFLQKTQKAAGAQAIITAHQQDDLLETAIINILRGTGRSGITSLKSSYGLVRPLLHADKNQLIAYAKKHKLHWREDPTNQDLKYMRNYVRHKILPQLSTEERTRLLKHVEDLTKLNHDIDEALIRHLHMQPAHDSLDRHWFIMLPHQMALELLATWLREHGARKFNNKLLEKLTAAAKTFKHGKQIDVDSGHHIQIEQDRLTLVGV